MLPSAEDFPYTIRIVSETLESNGSSSMAAICGGTLSLMDAGVPIKAPVAGIAMGLITDGNRVAILSDILGDEDHLGDMDFKVAGTADGITALQMDIKIESVDWDVMKRALAQAREGRLHVLDCMERETADELPAFVSREELSRYAPRVSTVLVKPDRIRDIIGPGGKVIRAIQETTGTKVDIDDNGVVTIFSPDADALEQARSMVEELTQEAELDRVYLGKVKRITDFGAFVEIFPGNRRPDSHQPPRRGPGRKGHRRADRGRRSAREVHRHRPNRANSPFAQGGVGGRGGFGVGGANGRCVYHGSNRNREVAPAEGLPLPSRATSDSAGYDLCAAVQQDLVLASGARVLVPTGYRFAIPPVTRDRSGRVAAWRSRTASWYPMRPVPSTRTIAVS